MGREETSKHPILTRAEQSIQAFVFMMKNTMGTFIAALLLQGGIDKTWRAT